MTAYDAAQWTDLFVATAGAAAALAGLVFVAVSINLERILVLPGIPERAFQTMLMLVVVVVVSVTVLIPGQDQAALGVELLLVVLAYIAGLVHAARRAPPPDAESEAHSLSRRLLLAVATVPLLIGALSVLVECGGGLYWIAAGVVGAIVAGVENAWVLLVEIQR